MLFGIRKFKIII